MVQYYSPKVLNFVDRITPQFSPVLSIIEDRRNINLCFHTHCTNKYSPRLQVWYLGVLSLALEHRCIKEHGWSRDVQIEYGFKCTSNIQRLEFLLKYSNPFVMNKIQCWRSVETKINIKLLKTFWIEFIILVTFFLVGVKIKTPNKRKIKLPQETERNSESGWKVHSA